MSQGRWVSGVQKLAGKSNSNHLNHRQKLILGGYREKAPIKQQQKSLLYFMDCPKLVPCCIKYFYPYWLSNQHFPTCCLAKIDYMFKFLCPSRSVATSSRCFVVSSLPRLPTSLTHGAVVAHGGYPWQLAGYPGRLLQASSGNGPNGAGQWWPEVAGGQPMVARGG